MRFINLLLLLFAVKRAKSASGPCPEHWMSVRVESTCYRLFYEEVSWTEAVSRCSHVGAKLLSLSHENEYQGIHDILQRYDRRNKDWWTSGAYSAKIGWEWQEDGSLITYDRWRQGTVPSFGNLVLTYEDGTYLWKSSKPSARHAFICELGFGNSYRAISSKRRLYSPFKFGWTGEQTISGHMPPRLVQQPETVTAHFGDSGPRQFVKLHCKATALPYARIRWFRNSGQEVKSSRNILKIGGSLVFIQISKSDFGSYHCTASNMYGTVRSKSASISFAYINDFPTARMDIYSTEGSPLSIPCQEPDHFPRTYSFGWIYDSINKFVPESDRVYVSRDGTLYFSYVLKSDAKSYSCNMVNYRMHMGHYGPFLSLKVDSPHETDAVKKRVAPNMPEDFLRIHPVQPQLGKPVWIECFAYGRPAPSYKWDMVDGSSVPTAVKFREHSRVLYIPEFKTQHVGTYRCTAKNKVGKVAKQIQLLFNSAPQMLTQLEDQFVTLNDTFQLLCDVYANPRAHYEWFRNGSPLSPLLLPPGDQARISIRGNRLTVKFSRERDSGVYQCIASNGLGEISASAFISVRGFQPNFLKQREETKVFASTEDYVILPCLTEASPTPLYSWKKGGKLIQYDTKMRLASNGSLRIGQVSPKDAGNYHCSASNRFGFSDGKVVLDVVGDLELSIEPNTEEIRLLPGENVTITCFMSPSYCNSQANLHCPEVAYSWTFNDFPLSHLPQWRRYKLATSLRPNGFLESRLSLVNVSALHSGTLLCRGDTLAGHMSKAVRINVSNPPPPPIGLKAIIDSDGTVRLSWHMPTLTPTGGYQGGVDSYMVQAVEVKQGSKHHKWFMLDQVLKSHHPVVDEFGVPNLKPLTLYKFRVKAHNPVGWGVASISSNAIQTHPTVPTDYPTGLRTFIHYPNEILVFWDPLPADKWTSDSDGYKLKWELVGSDDDQSSLLPITGVITSEVLQFDDPLRDHCVITLNETQADTNDCHQFALSIRTFNHLGDGPWSKSVISYVGGGDLDGHLRVLSAEPTNSTHALVSWSWHPTPSPDSLCESAAVAGFKLMCHPFNWADVKAVRVSIPFADALSTDDADTHMYKVVIGALDPTVLYTCHITAFAQRIQYSISTPTFDVLLGIKAPDSIPMNVNLELVADGGDEYSVKLDWSPPDTNESGVTPVGYKVFVLPETVWSAPIEFDLQANALHDTNHPQVYVKGLSTIMQYSIQVAAYGPGGVGPKTEKSTFRFGPNNSAINRVLSSHILIVFIPLYCHYLLKCFDYELS